MKSIFFILLTSLTFASIDDYGQADCIENIDSVEVRLVQLIANPQKLKTEPTLYDYKKYLYNDVNDTLFLYTVEIQNGQVEKKIFNGNDTLKAILPKIDSFLRITFASNPNSYIEYLLPENHSFDIRRIDKIVNNEVTIYIEDNDKNPVLLTLPFPE